MAARGECTCGPSSNERLTAARAEGYAEGRAAERADMLAFVEEACRLGTQGDALLRALMAKGKHEGIAAISRDDGYAACQADVVAWLRRHGRRMDEPPRTDRRRAYAGSIFILAGQIYEGAHVGAAKKGRG